MNIREAKNSDIYDVYRISNEKDIREASFNINKINLKQHKKWYIEKLKNENYVFLVVIEDRKLIGQVRFNIKDNYATISISIAKAYRHKHLGKKIMDDSIRYLKEKLPIVNIIIAYVRRENEISKKYFEKCKYELVEKTIIKGKEAYKYIYRYLD